MSSLQDVRSKASQRTREFIRNIGDIFPSCAKAAQAVDRYVMPLLADDELSKSRIALLSALLGPSILHYEAQSISTFLTKEYYGDKTGRDPSKDRITLTADGDVRLNGQSFGFIPKDAIAKDFANFTDSFEGDWVTPSKQAFIMQSLVRDILKVMPNFLLNFDASVAENGDIVLTPAPLEAGLKYDQTARWKETPGGKAPVVAAATPAAPAI